MSGYLYMHHLTRAVRALHGACQHEWTAFVHETNQSPNWNGSVEVFSLSEHPEATIAYAWAYHDGPEIRYAVFLNVPPIHGPHEAVQAWLAGRNPQQEP